MTVRIVGLGMLVLRLLTMLVVSVLAALPAMIHAVRIDPINVLRAE